MDINNKNASNFDLFDILIFLFNKKIQIIVITFIGIIASISISYTIQMKFKSTVVIYPSPNAYSLDIGEETKAEQMLQIIKSNNLSKKLIKNLNLYEHYEIDSAEAFAQSQIFNELNGNISFDKTEFDAIQITVYDKDPKMSAKIANEIISLLDTTIYEMFYLQSLSSLKYSEIQYADLLNSINMYEDSLNYYRKLGMFDYNIQVERFSEALAKGYANNTITNNNKVFFDKEFAVIAEIGGRYNIIKDLVSMEKAKLSDIRSRIIGLKAFQSTDLKHSFVIENGIVADKKSKPVRWLIVTLSTIGTFAFAIFTLLLIEFLKIFKKKLEENKTK